MSMKAVYRGINLVCQPFQRFGFEKRHQEADLFLLLSKKLVLAVTVESLCNSTYLVEYLFEFLDCHPLVAVSALEPQAILELVAVE